jgi:hypothetical protein
MMFAGPIAAAYGELALWRGRPEQAVELATSLLASASERECPQHTAELHAIGARAYADLAQAAPCGARPRCRAISGDLG